jgi:hypothetical protein
LRVEGCVGGAIQGHVEYCERRVHDLLPLRQSPKLIKLPCVIAQLLAREPAAQIGGIERLLGGSPGCVATINGGEDVGTQPIRQCVRGRRRIRRTR